MMHTADRTEPDGRSGRPGDGRVLIVGARRHCRRLARRLGPGPWSGLPVVGFVDAGQPGLPGPWGRGRQLAVHPQAEPVPVLGRIDCLAELVARVRATHLLVALPGRPAERLFAQLSRLTDSSVRIHWVSDEPRRPATLHDQLRPTLLVSSQPWPLRWGRLGKRLVDIFGAAIGLILLAPLFLAVAATILATSGRPIFYKQERIGQGGRPFRMWKFRSMRTDAEVQTGPIWASNRDERCTKVGALLRRTNIDELPQLFNVLLGEMSLVGPRPERPIFVEQFRASEPDYDLRHAMPAGMTGWAQVHGWRGRTSLRKRIQYDLDYIQRWSFRLDLQILLMTIQHVAWGKTSWGSSNPQARRRAEP